MVADTAANRMDPGCATMVAVATILAFHAHPDDEVMSTGGTLARLVAEGHRAIIIMATDGIVDEEESAAMGASDRLGELRASAKVLGVARVEHLGYADSGHGPIFFPDPPGRVRFGRASVDEAAVKLAEYLREEQVDVLLTYDAQGGYGHRDHVQVHVVGARAAELAGTPRVLEATRPREPIYRMMRVLRFLHLPAGFDPQGGPELFSPKAAITHRVDVRGFASQKRAALAAHTSQHTRTFRVLLRLPTPVFGVLLGREYFIDPALTPVAKVSGDVLAGLR